MSYATWAVASPAAANDPLHASAALGGKLNTADAAMVDAIDRTTEHDFVPSEGAYRVLGHSGSEAAPDQVMLEVVAPMTVGGQIMWAEDRRRHLLGERPLAADQHAAAGTSPQPSDPSLPVVAMTDAERNRVLDGLGWELFSNAPQG